MLKKDILTRDQKSAQLPKWNCLVIQLLLYQAPGKIFRGRLGDDWIFRGLYFCTKSFVEY